jgi:hypothetical protein
MSSLISTAVAQRAIPTWCNTLNTGKRRKRASTPRSAGLNPLWRASRRLLLEQLHPYNQAFRPPHPSNPPKTLVARKEFWWDGATNPGTITTL